MILYHGTSEPNFIPRFGNGRDYHDYGNGFYTTKDLDAAKEWACQGERHLAFVYAYELDTANLNFLHLEDVLTWVSVLMTHRKSRKIRGAALNRCNKMIERYGIDTDNYDIIYGFRADDSYFQFTSDFVTDTITLETLSKSIVAGDLGYQVCIKSQRAYQQLGTHVDLLTISGDDYGIYHNRYLAKDNMARKISDDYSSELQVGKLLSEILKEGSL